MAESIKLVANKELVITTNALNVGSYYRLADNNYTHGDAPTSIAVSTDVTIGPYQVDSHWYIDADSYVINNVSLSALQTDDDNTVHTSDNITALAPLAETNIAEIANDADGTAIALAVNSILGILVTAGLMAAPEEP